MSLKPHRDFLFQEKVLTFYNKYRWLYVIEGAGTMIAGLLAYFLLLDFPRSGQSSWLSEQEQRFAEWRLAQAANDEVDENGPVRQGVKDAVSDWKTWMLVAIQICLLSSQAWTYFFPVCIIVPQVLDH